MLRHEGAGPVKAFMLLPKLRVTQANCISGPLSWGFPAPSAFAGFAHALERKAIECGDAITVNGVAISCHAFRPYVSDGFVRTLRLTRNPLDSAGDVAAIVEEGRCDFEASIGLLLQGDLPTTESLLRHAASPIHRLAEMARAMRMAGGRIESTGHPLAWLIDAHDNETELTRRIARKLLPGRVLVAREDLLPAHLAFLREKAPSATALDALIDLLALHVAPLDQVSPHEAGDLKAREKVSWHAYRKQPGWLVPVPMGYTAISPRYEAGAVKNARSTDAPFRFVESVLGVGEWIHPFRIQSIEHMLWRHEPDPNSGQFLVRNHYQPQRSPE